MTDSTPADYSAFTDEELRHAWADEFEARRSLIRRAQGSAEARAELRECEAEMGAIRKEWLRRGMTA